MWSGFVNFFVHTLWERNVMMPISFQHVRACVVAKTSSNAFLGLDLSHTVVFLELLSIFKTMTMAHIPSFTFPFMQNHVCLDNFYDFCALKVKFWFSFHRVILIKPKRERICLPRTRLPRSLLISNRYINFTRKYWGNWKSVSWKETRVRLRLVLCF